MKTKFAVINTFNRLDNGLGSVISFHFTEATAEEAGRRYQRAVKKRNGSNSFIPMIIVEVDRKAPYSNNLHREWLV